LFAEIADEVSSWKRLLKSEKGLVLKPRGDGCSSGVLVAKGSCIEIGVYLALIYADVETMPWYLLGGNFAGVSKEFHLRMPPEKMNEVLIEELLDSGQDEAQPIEITIAVLGRKGKMVAMLPSETVSEFGVLTVEEKFCKGGGINLTPPPALSSVQIESIQERVTEFANRLGLDGYSRIDAMYFPDRDELVLIEINSLPGLSPATVTFTQALLTPGIRKRPSEFLQELISVKL
jgi:D-alanine-D-alanine ligase